MSIPVPQLIAETRVMSTIKNNQFFSDADVSVFLSDAGKDIADRFIGVYEHYFQAPPFDFTLAGGVGFNTVALPDDFQKQSLLLQDPTTNCPRRISMLGSYLERETVNPFAGGALHFIVYDQTLEVLPAVCSAGNFRLLYTPQFPTLSFPNPIPYLPALATTGPLNGTYTPGALTLQNAGALAALVLDTVAVTNGQSVLVKDQAIQSQNGWYTVANAGSGAVPWLLGRLSPYTVSGGVHTNDTFQVAAGQINAGSIWRMSTIAPITLDVSPLVFSPLALPSVLTPWAMPLKLHASIAIRQAREKPSDDLQVKFNQQMERITAAAANRSAEPRQAPISAHSRRWGPGGIWG